MRLVRLPIQSGSRELARDSEYLLPAKKKKNIYNFDEFLVQFSKKKISKKIFY